MNGFGHLQKQCELTGDVGPNLEDELRLAILAKDV